MFKHYLELIKEKETINTRLLAIESEKSHLQERKDELERLLSELDLKIVGIENGNAPLENKVFRFHYIKGYTLEKTAQKLNYNPNYIRIIAARLRKKINATTRP